MERNQLNAIVKNATEKNLFFGCHIDLTFRCNLNCIHCYVSKETRPELNTLEVKNLIDQAAKLNVLYLTFSGGEVLTRSDFFEICSHARKLHFALHIFTNATLINEEIADKLEKIRPEFVSISVYSLNPNVHDEITGVPGSFEKTLRAINILHKKNLKMRITNMIMRQNLHDYKPVLEMAKELKAYYVIDSVILPKIDGDQTPLQLQLNDDELEWYFCQLHKRGNTEQNLNHTTEHHPENHEISANKQVCGASHIGCRVSPYGDVTPCVKFHLVCGNIREQSLKDIWEKSPNMLKVRSMKTTDFKKCNGCDLKKHCDFCPGLSYSEHHKLGVPSKIVCKHATILKQTLEAKQN